MEWSFAPDDSDPDVAIPAESLLEVLGALIENGAQAMGGEGKGAAGGGG